MKLKEFIFKVKLERLKHAYVTGQYSTSDEVFIDQCLEIIDDMEKLNSPNLEQIEVPDI